MTKRFPCLAVLLFAFMTGIMGKGDKMPQYDITGAGSGAQGTLLVKVYVYAKTVKDEDLKRAAVHGVVFRGCIGNESGARQPAMAPPAVETDNAAFCEKFFATDGDCQKFATLISGSYDRVKTSKGYKVGATLQVDKQSLRRELEKAGVVRTLSSGF